MKAVEQFRASMRELGYTEEQINVDIADAVNHVRRNRRSGLLEALEKAVFQMTDEELKALEGGEL